MLLSHLSLGIEISSIECHNNNAWRAGEVVLYVMPASAGRVANAKMLLKGESGGLDGVKSMRIKRVRALAIEPVSSGKKDFCC